jgi:hypothetical protein
MKSIRTILASAMLALAGCAGVPGTTLSPEAAAAPPPQLKPCPRGVPAGAQCYNGQDGVGSFYWIAIPANWNHDVLVMHAHGGPADTGPAKPERATEDLERWAITVKAGYAWAGSTYRRGGYGVTMAAQDTERLRQICQRVHHTQPGRLYARLNPCLLERA